MIELTMSRVVIQEGVLPAWKNSPIKTVPTGLRKCIVASHKPPMHKLVKISSSVADNTTSLRDVSSMFDDDGDTNKYEPEDSALLDSQANGEEINPGDDEAMYAMFSPDQSVHNSYNLDQKTDTNVYYWDREDNIDEKVNSGDQNSFVQPKPVFLEEDAHSLDLQHVLDEATRQKLEYTRIPADPIDLRSEITRSAFLQEHVNFLSDFDAEFNSRISAAHQTSHSTASDRTDYQEEIISKLEHYIRLLTEVLHAMVMRQHQDIIELGLFKDN